MQFGFAACVPARSDEKPIRSSTLRKRGNRFHTILWGGTDTASFAHAATRLSDEKIGPVNRALDGELVSIATPQRNFLCAFETRVSEIAFAATCPCDIWHRAYKDYKLAKILQIFLARGFSSALRRAYEFQAHHSRLIRFFASRRLRRRSSSRRRQRRHGRHRRRWRRPGHRRQRGPAAPRHRAGRHVHRARRFDLRSRRRLAVLLRAAQHRPRQPSFRR